MAISDQQNKHDADKTRVELLPVAALLKAAEVFQHGAEKYSPWSWLDVHPWEWRYYASTVRHLFAWRRGERMDPDSGLSHLSHALTNLMIMVHLEEEEYGRQSKDAARRTSESPNDNSHRQTDCGTEAGDQ